MLDICKVSYQYEIFDESEDLRSWELTCHMLDICKVSHQYGFSGDLEDFCDRKELATLSTFIRFLISMDSVMSVNIRELGKGLATFLTSVRVLPVRILWRALRFG